jgi:ribonuclease HII
MATLVGIDENGLGPALGPLVSTAATLRMPRYEPEALAALGASLGIHDSKQTSAFRKMRAAESLALATAEALSGKAPANVDDFLAALSLDSLPDLQAPCPSSEAREQCWSSCAPLPAFGGDLAEGRRMLDGLGRAHAEVVSVRTVVNCVRRLNDALDAGRNKLLVNLTAFERLSLAARECVSEDVDVYCGMIGGIRDYETRFSRLAPRAVTKVDEGVRGSIRYDVSGLGRMRFSIDADAGHLPVAFASMIGKYVRELTTGRIVAYYRALDPRLEDVSGYHDPRTRAFVAASAPVRHDKAIELRCFLRTK